MAWIPPWALITTKLLELRRRRGLMAAVLVLTIGLPVLVLGLRLLFHAVDPKTYGPAGSPSVFAGLSNTMIAFGFIIAAVLGTTAGTTDLTDGVFRHLVVTGRSRLALYFARIPSGLAILLPLVAVGFTTVCLVTSYAGVPQPSALVVSGVTVPAHLSESQLERWIIDHPTRAATAFGDVASVPAVDVAPSPSRMAAIYSAYVEAEDESLDPPINEMVKIGLFIELEVGVGFMVGLGLGSLTGQRTLATILIIVLEIIVTPLLASAPIAYFLNGQRLDVGIALDQLRPAGLLSGISGHGGPIRSGGRGALGIPPMPTWAMIAVIVGWIAGWTAIGAWRMATRDA